jgi:hypothetical protein
MTNRLVGFENSRNVEQQGFEKFKNAMPPPKVSDGHVRVLDTKNSNKFYLRIFER